MRNRATQVCHRLPLHLQLGHVNPLCTTHDERVDREQGVPRPEESGWRLTRQTLFAISTSASGFAFSGDCGVYQKGRTTPGNLRANGSVVTLTSPTPMSDRATHGAPNSGEIHWRTNNNTVYRVPVAERGTLVLAAPQRGSPPLFISIKTKTEAGCCSRGCTTNCVSEQQRPETSWLPPPREPAWLLAHKSGRCGSRLPETTAPSHETLVVLYCE